MVNFFVDTPAVKYPKQRVPIGDSVNSIHHYLKHRSFRSKKMLQKSRKVLRDFYWEELCALNIAEASID